jgi:hypothetical protein
VLVTSDWAAVVESASTAVTALAAVAALVYARGQIREAKAQLEQAQKISYHDFLLRLDEAFQRHNKVHMLLQPEFEWGNNKSGPESSEDWFLVTSYMGLFERISFLVENGLVELKTVDQLYGYRVYNIVFNDVIRKTKLEKGRNEAPYWKAFIMLWLKLKSLHDNWNNYPAVELPR